MLQFSSLIPHVTHVFASWAIFIPQYAFSIHFPCFLLMFYTCSPYILPYVYHAFTTCSIVYIVDSSIMFAILTDLMNIANELGTYCVCILRRNPRSPADSNSELFQCDIGQLCWTQSAGVRRLCQSPTRLSLLESDQTESARVCQTN
jgi:hypothetical protein